MTEVPDHQRASVVKMSGDGSDVEKRAGAIVDMRQHGDRDFPINQGLDAMSHPQPINRRFIGRPADFMAPSMI